MRQMDGTDALTRVRQMRVSAAPAEAPLWGRLRSRRLERLKFRRQVWIGAYIADFLCAEAKLIVELDGSRHGEATACDEARSRTLATAGYRTLRFWNGDVTEALDGVLEAIRTTCLERLPSPSRAARGSLPLPMGEGI